jgi:hypothetical protein
MFSPICLSTVKSGWSHMTSSLNNKIQTEGAGGETIGRSLLLSFKEKPTSEIRLYTERHTPSAPFPG